MPSAGEYPTPPCPHSLNIFQASKYGNWTVLSTVLLKDRRKCKTLNRQKPWTALNVFLERQRICIIAHWGQVAGASAVTIRRPELWTGYKSWDAKQNNDAAYGGVTRRSLGSAQTRVTRRNGQAIVGCLHNAFLATVYICTCSFELQITADIQLRLGQHNL
jgi:hypothetical protein